MYIVSTSGMKVSPAIIVLFLIIGAMMTSDASARRCRVRVNGRFRFGVCAPRSVCPRNRQLRRPAEGCFGNSGCCLGPLLRCPRNRNLFVTLARDCRAGNDRGRVSAAAPVFIRCCRNAPPRRFA